LSIRAAFVKPPARATARKISICRNVIGLSP
jgi:hypothetical protein